jgi:hypothetical protein
VGAREAHRTGGSVTVLLANPEGNAESTGGVGVLTRCFLRSYATAPREAE